VEAQPVPQPVEESTPAPVPADSSTKPAPTTDQPASSGNER
ncbi:sugar transporter, partial [Xanthomonas oryzae pv. oryzae]